MTEVKENGGVVNTGVLLEVNGRYHHLWMFSYMMIGRRHYGPALYRQGLRRAAFILFQSDIRCRTCFLLDGINYRWVVSMEFLLHLLHHCSCKPTGSITATSRVLRMVD